jgi:BarA-like signal transduction histidine kinase
MNASAINQHVLCRESLKIILQDILLTLPIARIHLVIVQTPCAFRSNDTMIRQKSLDLYKHASKTLR